MNKYLLHAILYTISIVMVCIGLVSLILLAGTFDKTPLTGEQFLQCVGSLTWIVVWYQISERIGKDANE